MSTDSLTPDADRLAEDQLGMTEAKCHFIGRMAAEIESKIRSGDALKMYGSDSKIVKKQSKPDLI